MSFIKITEQSSNYDNLDKMSIQELLSNINQEDLSVPLAVEKAIPQIEKTVTQVVSKLNNGGRLFYIGAGTSGRLGILDASECPPTYGVSPDLVIGIIAGGDHAIRHAVENAEDNPLQGWLDLQQYNVNSKDIVIGIAASGTTPYVIKALEQCQKNKITTSCITCNPQSPLAEVADYPIEVIVGPEFVTGSSRMKAGTAQKLILNMISTSSMIQIGRVKGNKMVDMKMTNAKLQERGIQMIINELNIDYTIAKGLLDQYQNVRLAIESFKSTK
ncbi:N-acetylmuramic acid 6-phosphate etherase [Myroides profundi]|uniref:N-acetylmuramic acid 6-phosphate etherase n=1 Tax=Myroides profundi TaxID=480520 RepID=A0AAJ4W6L2_MYRPR|nr:N-acetylmuramic acid 6-phosphate etherase [Myroides profundi]AJH15710.1 N-acetylmuramic acid 6-phosphate etherase [Myroides profundi]SER50578.1 N-acetylmuramic acid 6-phosphate etherase [Myroides profundi]